MVPGRIPVSGHEKSMFVKSIQDALYDVWESLGMLWSILEHIWVIWGDFLLILEIIDFHPEMTSPHTKRPLFSSDLRADAQCFKIKTWCAALSSLDRALRGFPWSDGQVTQNDPQNDTFGQHQLHESNLEHQIFIGGMSSDYLGKFS